MSELPHLVGMVHLLPLPGAPGFAGSFDEIVTTAVDDARLLNAAGFPALMIENFGDVPYFADSVPAATVAAMTAAVGAVKNESGLAVGVNVLRNDALSALAVAAATGAEFIRVNVLTGTMYTDQGPIVGMAAEIQRSRAVLCPDSEIWADVMVKHATPPPGTDAGQAAIDTVERGGADALIFSGAGTSAQPDMAVAAEIRNSVGPNSRLVVGSGATAANLATLADIADTVIVGSSIKFDGVATNRVDPERAVAFVDTAQTVGLL